MQHNGEPLPYKTEFLRKWCNDSGVDSRDYPNLYSRDFLIAILRAAESHIKANFRKQIEDSLPLQGSSIVEDPRIKPNEYKKAKAYKAPPGSAFKITYTHEYEITDEFGRVIEGETGRIDRTFEGEYLFIDVVVYDGRLTGYITVREQPTYVALPVLDLGAHLIAGPSEEDKWYLPSKYDPNKNGGYILFSHLDGWEVVSYGDKLEGVYGKCEVKVVNYRPKEPDGLYIADFGKHNTYALDDFAFVDEHITLPDGYIIHEEPNGQLLIFPNMVSQLSLPPIVDKDVWGDLWYNHGIMLKQNPSAVRGKIVRVDAHTLASVEQTLHTLNIGGTDYEDFPPLLAIHALGGRLIDLKAIVLILNAYKPAHKIQL